MLTLRRAVSEGCTANKILTLKEKIMNIFLGTFTEYPSIR